MKTSLTNDGPAAVLEQRLQTALATLEPITTPDGDKALVQEAVQQMVKEAMALDLLDETEWAGLLASGAPGRALLKLGYQLRPQQVIGRYCLPAQEAPWLSVFVHRPEVGRPQPAPIVRLASGLSVHVPVLVLDRGNLILLQMVGPPEAVNANWAALVGGGKSHWLKGQMVRLGGMKHHVRLKATLPCGWSETWLIHHQASLNQMTPSQPFYLIDDGHRPLLQKFFTLADNALPIPMQAAWAEYLWLAGQQRRLVEPVEPEHSHGLAAWRIDPNLDIWETIVATGLQQDILSF